MKKPPHCSEGNSSASERHCAIVVRAGRFVKEKDSFSSGKVLLFFLLLDDIIISHILLTFYDIFR